MLSHAANIAVPIWRGTYCFLQCFFLCTCSLSLPPLLPASFLPALPSSCSPAPLLPPQVFSHIWCFCCPQSESDGKISLEKGGLWKLGLIPREGRGMMHGLSPLLLVSPVPQTTLIRDSGGKVRHKVLPLGSSSCGINPPLAKLVLHYKTSSAERRVR